jgi:hypothetical protein
LNTQEIHSSPQQGRSSGLIKKKLKNYERNMQELCNSIERPNLQIMDIKEEKEV